MVTELRIINNEKNIFTDEHYIVPLYQRGYAWEEEHIVQLIDDIMDVPMDGQFTIQIKVAAIKHSVYIKLIVLFYR